MAFKFVIFFAALAAVNAGIIETGWQQPQQGWQQPQHGWQPQTTVYKPATIVQPAIVKKIIHEEQPANYEFNYEVHDTHTGDIKRQFEKADNGKIHGEYSLVDADG
jgi:Insect cuticle protein